MAKVWRIKDLLEWTTRYFGDRGITESRLEAEVLLAYVFQKDRVYLYANYEEPVNITEREAYRGYIKRRTTGEPLAYITGHKEFMSLEFKVSPQVLIPRPDTEILVETAIALAQTAKMSTIIDVGTGSGAIAVSLAVYLKDAQIYASDISPLALDIARENAWQHRVDIQFAEGDLLEPFLFTESSDGYKNEQMESCGKNIDSNEVTRQETAKMSQENCPLDSVDMITANLPYIPLTELELIDPQVKDFEPRLALFAEGDGLELYRRLVPQAHLLLRPEGILLLEIDAGQANAIPAMMQGFTDIKIIKDLAGRERVVQARRKKDA